MVAPPSPPFIQARDYTEGGNLPVDRIVIHGTVSPTYCGGAHDIAVYFTDPTYESSCHYVVDPCEIYQCVNDWDIAWHAPPNAHSIGVELCDPQEGPNSRWDDAEHERMLDRAAALVRQLCRVYDVPMKWLMPDELRAGGRGITDHENVGIAWSQTSHVDPGWSVARSEDFMRRVTSGAEPAPIVEEDDEMKLTDHVRPPYFVEGSGTVEEALGAVLSGVPSVRHDGQLYNQTRDLKSDTAHIRGQLAGLTEAVKALGSREDLDVDVLMQRIDTAVREAVAESTVKVDVSVAGGDSKEGQ